MDGSLLEEDVGLIEKEDGTPGVRDVEDLLQFLFKRSWVGTELTSADHVEWAFEELRDALRGERLASSRRTVKNSY